MKFLKVFVFSFCLLSLPSFFKRDFKLPPSLQIPFHEKWQTQPPSEEIKTILNQSFFYLAHGNQVSVFESKDGNYVLKFFRYNRTRFPLLHQLKSLFRKKAKNDFWTKLNKTFLAAKIASEEAKEITQVLYAHLNLTGNELPKIQLHAHKCFSLELDKNRFVLQKKVTPFKEALLAARAHPEKLQRMVRSFFDLIDRRGALGICNTDPNLGPNFGFFEEQAVEIDFGNYRKKTDQQLTEKENFHMRLKEWFQKNAPESYDLVNEAASFSRS